MAIFKLIHLYIINLLSFSNMTDFVWSTRNASPIWKTRRRDISYLTHTQRDQMNSLFTVRLSANL